MDKKAIIISAINLTEGGPLSILNDCLAFLSENLAESFQIIALVHSKDLCYHNNITYLEFPKSKSSWFIRLYYEYYFFKRISIKHNPYLWFSLHDLTPNVKAEVKVVYCHNPSIFYRITRTALYFDLKFSAFNLLYKFVYRINIHKNNYLIVQQHWIRTQFVQRFNYPVQNIIVAYPDTQFSPLALRNITDNENKVFLYPAFGRIFKNFEVVLEACSFLEKQNIRNFKVILTIDGTENKYTSFLYKKYNHLLMVSFQGKQTREQVFQLYQTADCLLFPSKLETWGLPISEFKNFDKPILLVDLPYAKETLGNYEKVCFFGSEDYIALANLMKDSINNKLKYIGNISHKVNSPFANNWAGLFNIILKDD